MTDGPVLAIDIGGTKLAAGIVTPDGCLTVSDRTETPNRPLEDGEAIWTALEALLDKVVSEAGAEPIIGVGVGCGGPMTWPEAEVSPLNIHAWRGFPLRARLAARYPGLPVRVHNDAICVAIAEHWQGAGRGHGNVLGMVVSTGVGGGLILGGRLINGATGNAGHVGHIVVDPDGPPCGCGGRGCLEAIARGPGLAAWAREQGWRQGAGTDANSADPSGADLAADAHEGHPVAMAAMRRAGNALGVALASATHLLDLDVVAIGGGLSQAGDLLFDPLEEAFAVHARMEFARKTRIVPAALGQASGLIGAAALILRPDRYWTAAGQG
jgi:glucokinase